MTVILNLYFFARQEDIEKTLKKRMLRRWTGNGEEALMVGTRVRKSKKKRVQKTRDKHFDSLHLLLLHRLHRRRRVLLHVVHVLVPRDWTRR